MSDERDRIKPLNLVVWGAIGTFVCIVVGVALWLMASHEFCLASGAAAALALLAWAVRTA